MTTASGIDEDGVKALAALIDLDIPEPCLPAVAANLRLLATHLARLPDVEDGAS